MSNKDPSDKTPFLKMLFSVASQMSIEDSIQVHMDEKVIRVEYEFFITKEDI